MTSVDSSSSVDVNGGVDEVIATVSGLRGGETRSLLRDINASIVEEARIEGFAPAWSHHQLSE